MDLLSRTGSAQQSNMFGMDHVIATYFVLIYHKHKSLSKELFS